MKCADWQAAILLGAVVRLCFARYDIRSHHVELSDNSSATITSPGYGQGLYPGQLYYSWDIVAPKSARISITFQYIDLEYHPFCLRDTIAIYNYPCTDQRKRYTKRLCGRQFYYSFTSMWNVACVIFVTDFRNSGSGFKADISAIQDQIPIDIPATTATVLTAAPVTSNDRTDIPSSANHDTTTHTVQTSTSDDNTETDHSTVEETRQTSTPTRILTYTPIQQTTQSVTTQSNGQVSQSVTSPSNGPVSQSVTTQSNDQVSQPETSQINGQVSQSVTSPSNGTVSQSVTTQSNGPLSQSVTSKSNDQVSQSVTSPNNDHVSQSVTSPSNDQESQSVSSPSKDQVSQSVTSQSNVQVSAMSTSHTTTITPHTNVTMGDKEINICSRTEIDFENKTNVTVISPKIETSLYTYCRMVVKASELYRFKIEFVDFVIEDGMSCVRGYLEIVTDTHYTRLCGIYKPRTITIETERLDFIFRVDSTVQRAGFKLMIVATASSTDEHSSTSPSQVLTENSTYSSSTTTTVKQPTNTHTTSSTIQAAISSKQTQPNLSFTTPVVISSISRATTKSTKTPLPPVNSPKVHTRTFAQSVSTHSSITATESSKSAVNARITTLFTTLIVSAGSKQNKEDTTSDVYATSKRPTQSSSKASVTTGIYMHNNTATVTSTSRTSTRSAENDHTTTIQNSNIQSNETHNPEGYMHANITTVLPATRSTRISNSSITNQHATTQQSLPSEQPANRTLNVSQTTSSDTHHLTQTVTSTSGTIDLSKHSTAKQPTTLNPNQNNHIVSSEPPVFTETITHGNTNIKLVFTSITKATLPLASTEETTVTTTASKTTQDHSLAQTSVQVTDNIPQSTGKSSTLPGIHHSSACSKNGEPIRLNDNVGYIESPGFVEKSLYPPNTSCKWDIENKEDETVVVTFEEFDVEWSQSCRWDRLAFYSLSNTTSRGEPLTVLCGDHLPATLALKNDIRVEFTSDSMQEKRGFRFKYVKVVLQENTDMPSCTAGYSPCWESGHCIPAEWVCDGEPDCERAEDETGCVLCQTGELQCGNGTCIEGYRQCDGYQDCSDGSDELDCVQKGDDRMVSVTIAGESLPLCFTEDTDAYKDQLCRHLNYREALSTSQGLVPHSAYATIDESTDRDKYESLTFTQRNACPQSQATFLQCKGNECGVRRTVGRQKRIIGGTVTTDRELPWIVAVKTGETVVCGGTMVAGRWVVTAGHCVQDFVSKPHLITVIAGVNDIEDSTRQEYHVSEVVLHPNYKSIYYSDIALLRLSRSVMFSPKARPICLPWDKRPFTSSSLCVVAGWGVHTMADYFNATTSRHLRHAKTKLVDLKRCRELYSNQRELQDHMMCAGYIGGSIDACKGDSGGPLMCAVDGGSRWVLAGVVSWGDMCGGVGRPGVYTKVASFINWIDDTMGSADNTSVNCTFETADWCGYNQTSTDTHFWTRIPARNSQRGHYLYAERFGSSQERATETILLSPQFRIETESCLTFLYMFNANTNTTLSVFGHTSDQSGNVEGRKLWTSSADFPVGSLWIKTEAEVPRDITRQTFVFSADNGGGSGVGLDDVNLSPTQCKASRFVACNFDNNSICQYTSTSKSNFKAWTLKPKINNGLDYAIFAGGTKERFGFMATAQLLSPLIDYAFSTHPHCLQFSFNKQLPSNHELEVSTYADSSVYLFNRQLLWSSSKNILGSWVEVSVTVKRGYYQRIAFEVTRSRYDFDEISVLVDNIRMNDGYCI